MTVGVTDHAICRYLERVKGFDIDAVRQHIAGLCKGVQSARCVRAENADFIITAGVVVTVKPHGSPNPRKVPRGRGAE
jgi:hypothetical protein